MEVNQQYYKYWKDIWSSQSQEVLDATALIRVVECTNGCIQHAFRDEDERALSVEQTRECMKLSMGTIKNKVLPLPDGRTKVILPEECHEIMNTARDLYVRGFKQGDEEALEEFFALSKAHFQVMVRRNLLCLSIIPFNPMFSISIQQNHQRQKGYGGNR
jgi:hypothetical protein